MARIEGNYLVFEELNVGEVPGETYMKISGFKTIIFYKDGSVYVGQAGDGSEITKGMMHPTPDEFIAKLKTAMGVTTKGGKRKTRRSI